MGKIGRKKSIAITGLSGVIGQILVQNIGSHYDLISIDHTSYPSDTSIKNHLNLDLLHTNSIQDTLKKIHPDYFIHLAAVTHIDNCEADRRNGKDGMVWKINVDGSREIAKYCSKNKIPLVYLSTECVFDGKKEFYEEYDKKQPINWYGYTKSVAEDTFLSVCDKVSIIRSVVAYHKNDAKRTIYGKILNSLSVNKKTNAVGDQLFTPTYTKDIVKTIQLLVEKDLKGIYHVAPSFSLSPYDFAVLIANKNGYTKECLKKVTLDTFYGSEKASLRLKNSCLSSVKSTEILKFKARLPKQVI
jgi:dTDP-4-dehydrorhamnose reductase